MKIYYVFDWKGEPNRSDGFPTPRTLLTTSNKEYADFVLKVLEENFKSKPPNFGISIEESDDLDDMTKEQIINWYRNRNDF